MFVLNADDLRAAGQEMVVANGKARTIRMLTAAHEVGFSFSDVHFDAGAVAELWYKHHWEANHIISGTGLVEDLSTGESWDLAPGMLYNVGPQGPASTQGPHRLPPPECVLPGANVVMSNTTPMGHSRPAVQCHPGRRGIRSWRAQERHFRAAI